MTFYCGIDLGQYGALVVLDDKGALVAAHPTPLNGGVPDIAEARRIVASLPSPLVVFAEQPVKVMRGGESDSGYTALCASLKFWKAAFGKVPLTVVHPKTWQAAILSGVQGSGKQRAVNWCRVFVKGLDLYPGRRTTPHDGMSDAACIAEYARRATASSDSAPPSAG